MIGEPSDIAVTCELTPGPSLVVSVVDRHAFALERLVRELRGDRMFAAQWCERGRDFEFLALDKAFGLNLALNSPLR